MTTPATPNSPPRINLDPTQQALASLPSPTAEADLNASAQASSQAGATSHNVQPTAVSISAQSVSHVLAASASSSGGTTSTSDGASTHSSTTAASTTRTTGSSTSSSASMSPTTPSSSSGSPSSTASGESAASTSSALITSNPTSVIPSNEPSGSPYAYTSTTATPTPTSTPGVWIGSKNDSFVGSTAFYLVIALAATLVFLVLAYLLTRRLRRHRRSWDRFYQPVSGLSLFQALYPSHSPPYTSSSGNEDARSDSSSFVGGNPPRSVFEPSAMKERSMIDAQRWKEDRILVSLPPPSAQPLTGTFPHRQMTHVSRAGGGGGSLMRAGTGFYDSAYNGLGYTTTPQAGYRWPRPTAGAWARDPAPTSIVVPVGFRSGSGSGSRRARRAPTPIPALNVDIWAAPRIEPNANANTSWNDSSSSRSSSKWPVLPTPAYESPTPSRLYGY